MAIKNNYLVIDFGNSCIKAGVYTKSNNRLVETQTVDNKTSATDLIKKFACLASEIKIEQVIMSITARKEITDSFISELNQLLNVDIKVVKQSDFDKLLDLSNIDSSVKIGSDILVSAYYGIKTVHRGCVISFGTVYYCVFFEGNQISNVLFVPSLVKAMQNASQYGMIDKESIPEVFDKTRGLNTKDAFAAGANLLIEGAVDWLSKIYGLLSDHVLITGGDAPKYKNLSKMYKYDNMLIVKGLILLLKEKSW